jgi:hypothetical protein
VGWAVVWRRYSAQAYAITAHPGRPLVDAVVVEQRDGLVEQREQRL